MEQLPTLIVVGILALTKKAILLSKRRLSPLEIQLFLLRILHTIQTEHILLPEQFPILLITLLMLMPVLIK